MTIARDLARLRTPVQSKYGGVTPDFITGLNWSCTADNLVVFDSGVAVCPYPSGDRVVTVTSQFNLSVPTQASGTDRVHTWLHDDDNDGVGTIVIDNTGSGFTNYFGNAITHPEKPGWRYLGTVLLGPGRNPLRQRQVNGEIRFLTSVVGAPLSIYEGNTNTTAQEITINQVAPPALTTHIMMTTGGTGDNATRFAPSAATCGFTVAGALYTVASRPLCGEFMLPIGNDGKFQFMTDVTGQVVGLRVVGYRFKR